MRTNGARVGDLFMSLIYTCQLCGANPFDYLTELQRYRRELFPKPCRVDALELYKLARAWCGVRRGSELSAPCVWICIRFFKRFMRQEASGSSHRYALREGHLVKAKEC